MGFVHSPVINRWTQSDNGVVMRSPHAEFFIEKGFKGGGMMPDGIEVSPKGIEVLASYAARWIHQGERDLEIERDHPELDGVFYDIRSDLDLANRYAPDFVVTA